MKSEQHNYVSPADRSSESCPSMQEVFSFFDEDTVATPRDIAQNRLRESVVRLDCRRLCQVGYLRSEGLETYRLTPVGRDLRDCTDDVREKYIEDIEKSELGNRIQDLSELSSRGVKETNKGFYESEDEYTGRRTPGETVRAIMGVKGTRLYRVFREFPRDTPVAAQCAHWMRSFSGLHFFPDANHRTGMALLQGLLKLNEVDDSALPGRHIDRAVIRSKSLRILHLNKLTLRDLWKKDELYYHWYRYFRNAFYSTRDDYNDECPIERIKEAVKVARKTARV